MSETPATKWWWVRHAPVVDAHLNRLSGQNDVAADVSDHASFATLAPRLPSGAVWVTSHLMRTVQTAEALWSAGAERIEPITRPAFAEQAFGDWTGCSWDELDAPEFWKRPATVRPPGLGAESFADVCSRVAPAIDALNQQFAGRDIICVAHAGTIRAAVALALGLSPAQALGIGAQNLGLTRLDHLLERHWRVVCVNQVC